MKGEPSRVAPFLAGILLGAGLLWLLQQSLGGDGPPPDASAHERLESDDEYPDPDTKSGGPAGESTKSAGAQTERESLQPEAKGPDPSFGVLVYGTVRADDGSAVESAYVNFLSPDNDRSKNRFAQFEKGGYAVHGLTAGPWKVMLRGQGLQKTTQEVTVAPHEVQRIDLVAKRAYSILVKATTPDGKPLTAAVVNAKLYGFTDRIVAVATTEPPAGNLPMTFLRTHNRFGIGRWRGAWGFPSRRSQKFPPEVAGTLEFDERPPVFVSLLLRHHVLATKRIDHGQKEVTFEITPDDLLGSRTTIKARIVDAQTSEPIAKARVSISDHQSGGGGRPTGADGSIEIPNQPPGLLEFEVYAKGYAQHHRNLRLEPGVHDLGTIRLHRPQKIRGRLLDTKGEPIGGSIMWTPLEGRTFPQPLRDNRSTSVKADGAFELHNCEPGRYVVIASVKGMGKAFVEIDTRKLGEKPFELRLQPAVAVALDASKMRKGRHPMLTILGPNAVPVWADHLHVSSVFSTTLPAGRYTYELHDGLTLAEKGSLQVTPGSEPRLEIR